MTDASTPNDTFKFVMIRGPMPVVRTERSVLDLRGETARKLAQLPSGQRQATARKRLVDAVRLLSSDLVRDLESAAAQAGRTAAQVQLEYRNLNPDRVVLLLRQLTDALIAAVYAQSQPALRKRLARVYRLATLAAGEIEGVAVPIEEVLTYPIVVVGLSTLPQPEPGPLRPVWHRPVSFRYQLLAAIDELERFDSSATLVHPAKNGVMPAGGGPAFALRPEVVNRITAGTQRLLAVNNLDLARQPLTAVIMALEDLLWSNPVEPEPLLVRSLATVNDPPPQPPAAITQTAKVGGMLRHLFDRGERATAATAPTAGPPASDGPGAPPPADATFDVPLVQLRDVGQHFVVRQHLKRYEPIDIAHIQNVMPKETNSRTSRSLERTETTRMQETEDTEEHQKEHETADRLDVNIESARAVTEQTQLHGNFTLTGRYGPDIEFASELGFDTASTTTDSQQFATSFAKSVTDRTIERVSSRFRTSLTIRTVAELEETNVHTVDGPEKQPFRGIYQYVDKLYEAQLFDIGARTVADFAIPEPGAFLAAQRIPRPAAGVEIPPPPRLADHVQSQADINEANYIDLCALFGVADAPLPPPRFQHVAGVIRQPSEGPGSESDQPTMLSSVALAVPDGYQPWRLQVTGVLRTDETPVLGITASSIALLWEGTRLSRTDVELGGNHYFVAAPVIHANLAETLTHLPPDSNLDVSVLSWETGMFGLTVNGLFHRTAAAVAEWQGEVYRELRRGADRLDLAYQAAVAERGAVTAGPQEPQFGISPTEAADIIRTELKRSCVAILLGQQPSAAAENIFSDEADTAIDGPTAQVHARAVTLLEQAIEWENLQYILYPYFWGRRSTWEAHVSLAEEQPEIKAFLQAGSARVVVPLRPGFGGDFAMFLASNGSISGNQGDFVPDSYLPIDEELRARASSGPDGAQVGQAWDVRLPTRLTYLRDSEDLPAWSRTNPWIWAPAN